MTDVAVAATPELGAAGVKGADCDGERPSEVTRMSEESLDGGSTGGWDEFASDGSKLASRPAAVEQFLAAKPDEGGDVLSAADVSPGRDRDGGSEPVLLAKIVSTCNQLEEEPWLPVRSIVTMFRISVTCGDKSWELLRRYNEFHELDAQLAKSFDPTVLPSLPPKLLVNEDAAIATRFLELDSYIRGLLANPNIRRNVKLHDFLGVEKHGARYGVRRYEYDSTQSEGNRYIRDNDL